MRNFIFIFTLFFSVNSYAEKEEQIILTDTSIGNIPIEVGGDISLYKIRNSFRYHRVTQEIREGDSPDYHLFTVSTYEGEVLIYFISYINKTDEYEKGIVKLHEVIAHSPKIKDQYGISPKMTVDQAIAKRKDLKFGAGHMDNYLGKDKIWYMFGVEQKHGTQVTEQMAITANPKISVISWPNPWWY